MSLKIGAPSWPPPFFIIFVVSALVLDVNAQDKLMGGLISTRDIAELTQIATQFAAQTMNSNGELLSKPGRDSVRPLSMNARPSEMMSQSLTNMIQPATEQIARFMTGAGGSPMAGQRDSLFSTAGTNPMGAQGGDKLFSSAGSPQSQLQSNRIFPRALPQTAISSADLPAEFGASAASGRSNTAMGGGMGGLMDLASSFLGRTKGADGQPMSTQQRPIPSLKQLMPGASKNFGLGDGCLPFVGEFMQMMYGNCVKQADTQTFDTWGKVMTDALMGGKIDLLKASKETCKKGAEREQCGQLKKAVSDCDILGSIQLASNMKRSIDRCDEISGIIDQNPMTIMDQMGGLMNGEMAQGFLNNFLGGKKK